MAIDRVLPAAASVALVVVYAAGSAWLVSTGDVVPAPRPSVVATPDVVFGLIWPYNFVALVAAGMAVVAHGTSTAKLVWLVGLAATVVAALAWAALFYVGHALWPAAIALIVAVLGTVPIVVAAFTARTWAGVILVPYQVWLALAASLSIGYARLN